MAGAGRTVAKLLLLFHELEEGRDVNAYFAHRSLELFRGGHNVLIDLCVENFGHLFLRQDRRNCGLGWWHNKIGVIFLHFFCLGSDPRLLLELADALGAQPAARAYEAFRWILEGRHELV